MPILDCCPTVCCPQTNNGQAPEENPAPVERTVRGCLSSNAMLNAELFGVVISGAYTAWSIADLWPLKFVAENIAAYAPPAVTGALAVLCTGLVITNYAIRCADPSEPLKPLDESNPLIPENGDGVGVSPSNTNRERQPIPTTHVQPTTQTQQNITARLGHKGGVLDLNEKKEV